MCVYAPLFQVYYRPVKYKDIVIQLDLKLQKYYK